MTKRVVSGLYLPCSFSRASSTRRASTSASASRPCLAFMRATFSRSASAPELSVPKAVGSRILEYP